MYPNLGAGSNLPSAPPPPSSSSTLSNSGTSRPVGFSSLMSQPNNQSTPYPSGPSSQPPYPPGPPSSSIPNTNPHAANNQAQNTNNYSVYSLPNIGNPPPSSQGGSGYPPNPYQSSNAPPPQSNYQNPSQSGNPYGPPQGSNSGYQNPSQSGNSYGPPQGSNPGYQNPSQSRNPYGPPQGNNPSYQNPYQSQQGGYPPQGPSRPTSNQQQPYQNPYGSNPQQPSAGGYPPYNQQQQQQQPYQNSYGSNPQQPSAGGYPPYNQQQQQPYQTPYSSYPQQAPGGYPPYNQQQGYPPAAGNNAYGTPVAADRIRAIAGKYEISDTLAQRLNILQQFEIVVLCDDSGSMNTPVDGTNGTRWDELRSIVQIVIEIGTVFDSNGVDIYFLNRPPMRNVTDPRQVVESFSKPPGGYTPLTPALRQIFQSTVGRPSNDKRLLIFIATDGAPTDTNGNIDIQSFENLMRNERQVQTTYVTFLACTDDAESVEHLSQWDRTMPNVDVVDDYKSEREEVRRTKGFNFPFTFGDYVAKALLGAVDPQMDALDEAGGNYNYNNPANTNFRRY